MNQTFVHNVGTSHRIVPCSIANDDVYERVKQALESKGYLVSRHRATEMPEAVKEHLLAGAIYDLAPWTDDALVLLSAVKRSRPDRIVMVIPPWHAAVSHLIEPVLRVHGVILALINSEDNPIELERCIRRFQSYSRPEDLKLLLCSAFGRYPGVRIFVMAVMDQIVERNAYPFKVRDIIQGIDISLRAIERLTRRHGLPGPKRIVDWLLLLWALHCSESMGDSASRILTFCSGDARTYLRLRKRLSLESRIVVTFDTVFERFLRACHIPAAVVWSSYHDRLVESELRDVQS